jgi:hypothetical protein
MLRLHHLTCLALVAGDGPLSEGLKSVGETATGEAAALAAELRTRLLGDDSPYRPLHCFAWTGDAPRDRPREADAHGPTTNASLTHLGCVEIVRPDGQGVPAALDFLPLDDISGIVFSGRGVFRLAKVFHEITGEGEILYVPLLYGLSWHAASPMLRDGGLTWFRAHVQTGGDPRATGVGLGQQDLLVGGTGGGDATLIGLGSVAELAVGLSLDDPRFEAKCGGRGLDPEAVRRNASDPPPTKEPDQ